MAFIKGSELLSLLGVKPVVYPFAVNGERVKAGVSGFKEVLPVKAGYVELNKRDLDEIPADVREQLTFVWVEQVDEAVAAALAPATNVMP